MVPVPKAQGVSEGYLRPAEGLVLEGTGAGFDRGGINWNGVCYRVMGSKFCSIDQNGVYNEIGDVGNDGNFVEMDYSFDRLGIASAGYLYYFNGTTLSQVTSPYILTVKDVVWMDGYFITTDGNFIIVTELTDPTIVDPLKYGTAESDPDGINALLNYNEELYAVGRYTIQVLDNTGGDNFPFTVVKAAIISRGAIGTHAVCIFVNAFAFIGGNRNEPPSVYLGINGGTTKIATREIDKILKNYTEDQLSKCKVECRVDDGHQWLYVHLPDQTLVYDQLASKALGDFVWFTLDSGLLDIAQYRAACFVWCYNKWIFGDPSSSNYGHVTHETADHYGNQIGHEFSSAILYNSGKGAIIHRLELVCLTGRVALGADPTIWTSYSKDGVNWSQEKPLKIGKIGNTTKRIAWLRQGDLKLIRLQKFRFNSDAFLTVARLEAEIEALYV
jgi:Phage stabilisation protein